MRPQHDLIVFYRHVLRSGDVALSRRLGQTLLRDPHYRARAMTELRRIPCGEARHSTAGGRMLDSLLDQLGPLGDT
jgi:hypothetical protein